MKLSEQAKFNFTKEINRGALLTVQKPSGEVNTMTVSWGQAGVLWGREVCTIYVRPQRYTYEFCENGEIMTLSFFDESFRPTLAYCGTKSGRDVNKFETCDLKYAIKDNACIFDKANLTLILKKLYAQDLIEGCFVDKTPLSSYKNGDFHRAYTCEIIDVII